MVFRCGFIIGAILVALLLPVFGGSDGLCDVHRSRQVRQILTHNLMPSLLADESFPEVFADGLYAMSSICPLNPLNDVLRYAEERKLRETESKWVCAVCGKSFVSEYFLDAHFARRHASMLDVDESDRLVRRQDLPNESLIGRNRVCLADICDITRCDLEELTSFDRSDRLAKCTSIMPDEGGMQQAIWRDMARRRERCYAFLVNNCGTFLESDHAVTHLAHISRHKLGKHAARLVNASICDHLTTCRGFFQPWEHRVERQSPFMWWLTRISGGLFGVFLTSAILLFCCFLVEEFKANKDDMKRLFNERARKFYCRRHHAVCNSRQSDDRPIVLKKRADRWVEEPTQKSLSETDETAPIRNEIPPLICIDEDEDELENESRMVNDDSSDSRMSTPRLLQSLENLRQKTAERVTRDM